MGICVFEPQLGVDAVFCDQGRVATKLANRASKLFHLLALLSIFHDRLLEVEVGGPEVDARGPIRGELREDFVRSRAPFLGTGEEGLIFLMSANGGRPLPERTRDDRRDVGSKSIRDDGDLEPLPGQADRGRQTAHTGSNDEYSRSIALTRVAHGLSHRPVYYTLDSSGRS